MEETFTVYCEVTFDAAHSLPLLPKGHKCRNIHGHSYRVIAECTGKLNEYGFVEDYGVIRDALKSTTDLFDHKCLNDTLFQPSTERMALFIYDSVKKKVPSLFAITIYETPGNACRYQK